MELTSASSSGSGSPPALKINESMLSSLAAVLLNATGHHIRYPTPQQQQQQQQQSILVPGTQSLVISRAAAAAINGADNVSGSNVVVSRSSIVPPALQKICRYHHATNNHAGDRVTGTAAPQKYQQLQQSQSQCSHKAAPSQVQTSQQAPKDAVQVNSTPQANACLIADRYLLLDPYEGSSLYKSFDISTKREFVCKIANKPCTNLLTAHFRLDGHPHVNQIEKVIDTGNRCYLFFNPSQGDLHSHVRVKKRLRENEARRLFRQMCEVVKSCHAQGIVLRDLKLRKFVFVDAEKTTLKLETLEDTIVLDNVNDDLLQNRRGCPAYVSPEILKANTQYSGKAADMWSLGVILYTMLVGRYPFNDSEHVSLFAKISRGQYVVPECLSAKARCIIKALLRRDPDERISSSDILSHPWLRQDDLNRDFSRHAANDEDQVVPDWR